ncbi:NmrA/HSCARG family protein [Kibdelosporangium aridum]|uniref:Uncharacterized conserved protein YbjT, contains NAD(P)-binding and DUF2867 domains n=1 Tax=Kibdelosporangium aridum TaxID=2030 RepID=A0A1W2FVH2_KIBAR|nr:NmrA/HSCARG family protein [Kibdelosporangium aridum]SMD25742.1 Uncharacterized conserved protein YbjT, contains NAD(P)-binding and DUF2867 domains [Kibdelosporangium aridum]
MDETILVLGATGKQGGAVARELLRRGRVVHALVRDPDRRPALALAEAGAVLVRGDMNDEESLRAAMTGITAVFSVQTFLTPGGVEAEERQGKAVAEAAAKAGVHHFVYTSVGGAERSTGIPHFESKWAIEQHIQKLGLPATVLRPVMFHECFNDITPRVVNGQFMLGLAVRPDIPVQLIATSDIGLFAADAFDDPGTWIDRQIEIAGDELTGPQMAEAFERATGTPTRYQQLPLEPLRGRRDDLAAMFEWFEREGYQADLPALRRMRPDLVSLESWVRTSWTPPAQP